MTKLHTSRSRILQAALALFTLVALHSLPLFGQASSGYGAIAGTATDPSGSVVPNVAVRIRNVGTNAVQTLETNAVGRYQAPTLQPGDYEITAIKSGFANLVRTGVTVAIGQIAVVDLNLTVAGTTETITVAANTATVETEKTEVSTVVNLKDMLNLPLNGRRWDTFAMTAPGVSNDGGFGLLTFRGISGLYNNNMIDGMDNNQAFFSEARGRTRLSYAISAEAIQEFQVGSSNFSSQYGRSAGGVVNAVTKSGSNDIHGTFFYIIRDESLNASNSVASLALKNLGLPPKPKDRRQQFGPSVGGAIKKDKLFYFLSYDQQKRVFPAVVVPGASSFLTQTGDAPGFSNALNFYRGLTGPQDRAGSQWLGLARVDYNITNANQLSATVNILRWDSPNGIQTAPTHSVHATANGPDGVNNEIVIGRWNSIVTPNFISDLRFQYGRDFEFQLGTAPGPFVQVTNGIDFGLNNFLPRLAYPNEKRYQVAQNLSWLRGRHSFRFGYDLNWVSDGQINLFQGGGQYAYSLLNDLALDCPNITLPLGTCTPTAGTGITGRHYSSFQQAFDTLGTGGTTTFRNNDIAFYFEDSIKPFRTLTLNLGLRYDIQTMPSLKGNPDLPLTNKINVDKNNFGPRIGLAWDPTQNHSTVIRAGAGMYYGRTQNSTVANLITNNGQRFKGYLFLPSAAGAPAFASVLSDIPTGAAGKPNVVQAAPDFVNPLIYQMEFSIEREVFRNFTLTGVYMATRGQHMPLFRDTNLFPTTQSATYTVCGVAQVGSSITCPQVAQTVTVPFYSGARPNSNYGFLTQAESVVNTWYNGVVIQAKQRFSRGFQLQASLTISKAQDDDQISQTFSSNNQPLNPFNVRNDYSLSNFDQRKRFTMSAIWQPPFSKLGSKPLRTVFDGFQLSSIVSLVDGRPYSPLVSGNPSPSGVSTGLLGAGGDARVPFLGRNVYTNPGSAVVDFRLAREIKIRERFRWQLIAEAFNLFNRDNVTSITTTQYNIRNTVLFPRTDFQAITATGTNLSRERQLQFGTRFTF
jgi:hypothetical protein